MSELKVEDILEPTQPDKEAPQETKQESKKEELIENLVSKEKKPEKKAQPKKAEPFENLVSKEKKPEKTAITYPVKVKVGNEVTIFANRQFTKVAGKASVFTVLGIQENVGTVCFGNKFIGCVPCNEEVLKEWMDS